MSELNGTDLQELFWRTPGPQSTPLEDFTSAALAIAIGHDERPLIRLLEGVTAWKAESGSPALRLAEVKSPTAHTQEYLPALTKNDAGRLDVVVRLEDAAGLQQDAWIEVKINAPVSGRQCEIYLLQRRARPVPQPFILTLTKTGRLCDDITGISWDDVVAAVEAVKEPEPDRWWGDLVAFLRAEGVVIPPLPPGPVDPADFLPVFRDVNMTIKHLWPDAPKSLHYTGIDRWVLRAYREQHHMFMTGGPFTWGLRPAGDGWEWCVAMGTGTSFHGVFVSADAVREAARAGGLPASWTPTANHRGDRLNVFEKTRPLKGEAAVVAIEWLSQAMHELHDAGLLDPYHEALRAKLDLGA